MLVAIKTIIMICDILFCVALLPSRAVIYNKPIERSLKGLHLGTAVTTQWSLPYQFMDFGIICLGAAPLLGPNEGKSHRAAATCLGMH